MTGSVRTCSPLWMGDAERSVTAKLPPKVHDDYAKVAAEMGLTKGALTRMIIKEFVEQYRAAACRELRQ